MCLKSYNNMHVAIPILNDPHLPVFWTAYKPGFWVVLDRLTKPLLCGARQTDEAGLSVELDKLMNPAYEWSQTN